MAPVNRAMEARGGEQQRDGVLPCEELHRHASWNLAQADALLFGRVTYEMMEAAWWLPARTGAWPDWMESWSRRRLGSRATATTG